MQRWSCSDGNREIFQVTLANLHGLFYEISCGCSKKRLDNGQSMRNTVVLMLRLAWEMSKLGILLTVCSSSMGVIRALDLPLFPHDGVDRLKDATILFPKVH